MMLCSFQVPELNQPSHGLPMPPHVPPPEECMYEEEINTKALEVATDPARRELLELRIMVRPWSLLIAVKVISHAKSLSGSEAKSSCYQARS